MNRRLNPDLFGPNSNPGDSGESNYSLVAARKLESELKTTNKRLSHLESLLEVIQTQMSTMASHNERRTEAFSKALSELEKDFREQNLQQIRVLKTIEDRMREQRIKDSQTEMMVERFNTTLTDFDNKLATLKKVLSEKDMTLLTYRKIIEQIVEEVERMKNNRQQPRL